MAIVRIHRVRGGARPGLEATIDGGRCAIEFASQSSFRSWSDSYDLQDMDALKLVCKERLIADPTMGNTQSWIGQTTVSTTLPNPPS